MKSAILVLKLACDDQNLFSHRQGFNDFATAASSTVEQF